MGAGKGPEPQALGGTAIKPVGWDRTGWEAFRYMIWNPDTGEVLTRTPLSWAKITVFYCIYYSCLAAFWLACLNIFFLTLPENKAGPKWQKGDGLIGNNPGVGLRPKNTNERIDSQMFKLVSSTTDDEDGGDGECDKNACYAVRMRKFLEAYDKPAMEGYQAFNPTAELGPCGTFPYGFTGPNVKPCIVVKFNKIWDWVPTPIDAGDFDLEENKDWPAGLKTHWEDQPNKDNIWVHCEGRNAADKEALDITYFPDNRGISTKYFPYIGEFGSENKYHSPLVAIKVDPTNAKGQLMHIECRAYFKGVKHVTKTKEGLVQFEVIVTDPLVN